MHQRRIYDTLDWLTDMASHVRERGKQSIRYYGAYANSVRGTSRKREEGELSPAVLEPVISSGAFRRNWAGLIRKVYETDPLGRGLLPGPACTLGLLSLSGGHDVPFLLAHP